MYKRVSNSAIQGHKYDVSCVLCLYTKTMRLLVMTHMCYGDCIWGCGRHHMYMLHAFITKNQHLSRSLSRASICMHICIWVTHFANEKTKKKKERKKEREVNEVSVSW